jgi:hypothetical protein
MAHTPHRPCSLLTRREMLALCRNGFGSVAFAGLLGSAAFGCRPVGPGPGAEPLPMAARRADFVPRARSVIFLYMDGGVSQVDSFDPKPRLDREHGQSPYAKFAVDNTQFDDIGTLLKSPWAFRRYGESGMPVSELFPHIATCVDDLALIRSMVASFPEHTNANYFLHTGIGIQGRPSMGAWVTYGLGSENQDLPGYVVLDGGLVPPGGLDNFNSGFLPAAFQGSIFRNGDLPLANVRPLEPDPRIQASKRALLQRMDGGLVERIGHADAVESSIANYELAFRMQASVPELIDLSGETGATRRLYGLDSDDPHTRGYGMQCLLARRLVERGVRFVELTCPRVEADRWDQHAGLRDGHERNAHAVDRPIAGLLKDLKARGLFDQTLVVWSGEFGRTPFAQGSDGRDHNPSAFSIWLAGAGVRGGTIYGETDEYGYRVVDKPTTIHDLHATMLHLLGLDHETLTFRFGGRDIRLTDVHGHVVRDILV